MNLESTGRRKLIVVIRHIYNKEYMIMKTLVAYFTATGTTGVIATELAKAINADTYEIVPVEPYTNDDLNL